MARLQVLLHLYLPQPRPGRHFTDFREQVRPHGVRRYRQVQHPTWVAGRRPTVRAEDRHFACAPPTRTEGSLLAGCEPSALLLPEPHGLVVPVPARQFQDPFTRSNCRGDDAVEMNVVDFDADALCNRFWHVSFLLLWEVAFF